MIRLIELTVTHDDGTTSRASIGADGYNQWGADTPHLGAVVPYLEALETAFSEETRND